MIEARVTTYDNGIITAVEYQDGTRARMVQDDNPQYGRDGVKSWSRIETYYDENGKLDARITDYDDGRHRVDEYNDGMIFRTTIEDDVYGGSGAYGWDQQLIQYDGNGDREVKITTYDNGDATGVFYDMGTLYQRKEFDGDESHSWVGKVTTYNADGSVAGVDAL